MKEGIDEFMEKIETAEIHLRMGDYVGKITEVQHNYPEKGKVYMFGLWSCGLLDGVILTDAEYQRLMVDGATYSVAENIEVSHVSYEEAEQRWQDVDKVVLAPFKYNGKLWNPYLLRHQAKDSIYNACAVHLWRGLVVVTLMTDNGDTMVPWGKIKKNLISQLN